VRWWLTLLPLMAIMWIFYLAIFIPMMLLGWIIIPPAAITEAYLWRDPVVGHKNKILCWEWDFMWLWGNDEDGIWAGEQYLDLRLKFLQIIYWSAWRNPVNNLRFCWPLTCMVEPQLVNFIGSFMDSDTKYISADEIKRYDSPEPQWFFCWQGLYSNFYWQFRIFKKLWRFWIGWKIMPADKLFGISEYRKKGSGFALQLKAVS
jgi:hypothetical protein